MPGQLTTLFEPSSIAVVGASPKPEKTGNIILQNLLNHHYTGKIYPVNPNETSVCGLRSYPNVKSIPEQVDVAYIVVPAPSVVGVIRECAEKGVKHGIVISAGFGEASHEGAALERQMVEVASKGGMRLLGPNTLGVVNTTGKMIGTAVPFQVWRDGGISLAAQTGVFAGAVADWIMDTQHMGIGKVVGLGNKCDLDESDMLDYYGSDRTTRVVGLYVEGINDGRRLMRVASEVTKNKPVVMIKSGRTETGARVAASHTGSLASRDEVVEAALKQCGIIRADNFEEFFALVKSFDYQPLPRGNRVGILTLSGASGVLAADMCARVGLRVAELSQQTRSTIQSSIMPPWQPVGNPVDIWIALGAGPEKAHRVALDGLLNDRNVDSVLAILLALSPASHDVAALFSEIHGKHPEKPIVAAILGGRLAEKWFNELEGKRIPSFLGPSSPETAAKSLGGMHRYASYRGMSSSVNAT